MEDIMQDKKSGKITDCFFDLYGTLIDIETREEEAEVWNAVSEQIMKWKEMQYQGIQADSNDEKSKDNMTPEALKGLFIQFRNKYINLCKQKDKEGEYSEFDMEFVFAELLISCDIPVESYYIRQIARIFRKKSIRYCKLYEGAREFLLMLKSQKIRLWLVSNAQSLFTRPEITELKIDELFDGIYISSEQTLKKPDVRLFEKVLKDNQINRENCVMIGNDPVDDILPAKACGLKTIYLSTNLSNGKTAPEADISFTKDYYENAFKWIVKQRFLN